MLRSSNYNQCLTSLSLILENNFEVWYALLSCHVFAFHFLSIFLFCFISPFKWSCSLKWVVRASLGLISSSIRSAGLRLLVFPHFILQLRKSPSVKFLGFMCSGCSFKAKRFLLKR